MLKVILFTILKGLKKMDFKMEIAKLISSAADIDVNEVISAIEIPPNSEMGDYAYPCFKLAKVFRKAPPMIANELVEKIEKKDFIKEKK